MRNSSSWMTSEVSTCILCNSMVISDICISRAPKYLKTPFKQTTLFKNIRKYLDETDITYISNNRLRSLDIEFIVSMYKLEYFETILKSISHIENDSRADKIRRYIKNYKKHVVDAYVSFPLDYLFGFTVFSENSFAYPYVIGNNVYY